MRSISCARNRGSASWRRNTARAAPSSPASGRSSERRPRTGYRLCLRSLCVHASSYQPSASRLIGFGLVLLLHVGIVYALVNGLARRAIDVVRAPIETKIIDEAP